VVPKAGARSTAGSPPVTILKPLHGDEPGLFENLASFHAQNYPAPVQIIFGVHDDRDSAIGVVERLQAEFPDADLQLVVDQTPHGSNLKVGNLINLARHARYDCVVLADSDIRVEPGYLGDVVATLSEPGVGAATCLYRGVAAGGFWSRLSALGIDAHFLPNVLVGLKTGLAAPCFGSTIAMTRDRLEQIGGFEAFTDRLADDYAIGAAIRSAGLRVAISNMLVAHSCWESSFLDLWRRELRWARTIKSIDPVGYAGSLVTHPLGWALLGAASGAPASGLGLAALAIASRIVLMSAVSRNFGLVRPPYWLAPPRDLLSFVVFLSSFLGNDLTWRGRRYRMQPNGRLILE